MSCVDGVCIVAVHICEKSRQRSKFLVYDMWCVYTM
jgi:hypothetical protein